VIETIDGQPPATWFAGKAGWKTGDLGAVAVLRGTAEKAFEVRYQPIPEDVFARIVGVHMVEAHLAYLDAPPEPKSH
jgi:hypothetical protein